MKRILIANNNMYIGGIQKSLVNLLQEISEDYEVTLLLFNCEGELMKEIPPSVKVISAAGAFRTLGMDRNSTKRHRLMPERALFALISRTAGRRWAVKIQSAFQKKLTGYDAAISFMHSGDPHTYYGGCNEFILNCVESVEKISFLHCDYGEINAHCPYNTGIYERFDKIAACSEGCRKAFVEKLPQMGEKTAVVHNCHNFNEIKLKAQQGSVSLPADKINILTVARFGKEKGIPRAIEAISMLGEAGEKARFFIIGSGTELEKTRELINEHGLQDKVLLLGEMANPYGYMKAADLLLIPSYSEAAPMVISEAASLGTPILSTETSSAEEMLIKSGYGWVCPNSKEGIRDGLIGLISEPERLEKRRELLLSSSFSNEAALREFRALLN